MQRILSAVWLAGVLLVSSQAPRLRSRQSALCSPTTPATRPRLT